MVDLIELRGFMGLFTLFKKRNWPNPYFFSLEKEVTGFELLERLDIQKKDVEILFINGKAFLPFDAIICPGDRVALVPPGTPGPYRVLLGFIR